MEETSSMRNHGGEIMEEEEEMKEASGRHLKPSETKEASGSKK